MPYIKPKDRAQFVTVLNAIVDNICLGSDTEKCMCLARFLCDVSDACFKITVKSSGYKINAKLTSQISELLVLLDKKTKDDLFGFAGKLHFILSYVIWRVLGRGCANYGFRTFIKGVLWHIYDNFEQSSPEPDWNKDQHVFIYKGVITDVIDEMYRRQTCSYTDAKMIENGDII